MTKAREIPTVIANKGMERAMTDLMVEAFERLAAMEQTTQELALMQLQIIKTQEQVVQGATSMREAIERMQLRGPGDDDDLPDTAG